MALRKTSKDYRKEYGNAKAKLSAVEARIKDRAINLCKQFPEAPIGMGAVGREIDKPLFENCSTETYLDIIRNIEKYNEKNSPVVQKSMF